MDGLFCYHIVVMFVSSVALCLLWVGFATPGWLVITFQESLAASEGTVSSLNRSLFYDILCPQELKTCQACEGSQFPNDCIDTAFDSTNYNFHYTWIDQLIDDKENWTAWRVIMVIVVVSAILGFALVLVLVCCSLKPSVYRIIAGVTFFSWLVAGLLVWIPVGMVADMHLSVDDDINDDVVHDATLHVPYSIVIAAVGGFVALVTAIMLIYLIGICCKRDGSSRTSSSTEDDSDPSKRTGLQDPRYYAPHPYYSHGSQIMHSDSAPAVSYQYPTPQLLQAYQQYPESAIEDDILSEQPHYRGESYQQNWYDNMHYRGHVRM